MATTMRATPGFLRRTPAPALRARRSPRLIVLGLLCACLGGLGSALALHQLTDARQIVVVSHDVVRGEVVRAADLGTVSVGAASGVSVIPAEQLDSLVGKTALVDLGRGAVLAPGDIGEPTIAAGRTHVGLRLPAGRVPGGIRAGSPIVVASAPGPTDDASVQVTLVRVDAQVASSPVPQSDGGLAFDIDVPESASLQVATLAAAERLVVVAKGGGR